MHSDVYTHTDTHTLPPLFLASLCGMRDLSSWPGTEPLPPQWKQGVLTIGLPVKSYTNTLLIRQNWQELSGTGQNCLALLDIFPKSSFPLLFPSPCIQSIFKSCLFCLPVPLQFLSLFPSFSSFLLSCLPPSFSFLPPLYVSLPSTFFLSP